MHRADASDIFPLFSCASPPFSYASLESEIRRMQQRLRTFFFFFFFGVWVCVMLSSSNVASGRKPEAEMTHSYRVLLPFHHSGRFQYCN